MKNQCILLFLILFSFFDAKATHIVGGQLFFTKTQGYSNQYRIGLDLYFDAINGNPDAEDPFVTVYIFRKRDNTLITPVQIPKVERNSVNYINPVCGISSLKTNVITYALDVTATSNDFNDPQGYYIVWDRCCRNGTITNIKSPGDAGSLFYLEFPAMVRSGTLFANSSPVFRPIQGDYACANLPFSFDFGGSDPDGDSLVYTLVIPRQGYSNKDIPSAQGVGSSNYPQVTLADGLTVSTMIPGPKPLAVNNKTGMLTVTPANTGLYVFAVQVDEYRNKIKIGTVTRDFQLKVVDCPRAESPSLLYRPKGKNTFYSGNEIITIKKDDPNCMEIMLVDPSVNDIIKVSGSAVNNSKAYFSLLPSEFKTTTKKDTLRFEVCLDDCFVTYDNRPIRLELIAEDASCPVPLQDTLTIYIKRENNANIAPKLTTSLPGNYVHVSAGQPTQFTVYGLDSDKDDLKLSAEGSGFSLSSHGMSFTPVSGKESVQQNFTWTPPCHAQAGDTLVVDFMVEDMRCDGNPFPVTKSVYFIVDESKNAPPTVSTTLATPALTYTIGQVEPILFDVSASDPDTNHIVLAAHGRDFDMKAMGMSFTHKTGRQLLTSPYQWTPDCALLKGEKEKSFTIDFVTQDKNCLTATDTTSVLITIIDQNSVEMPELPNVITPNQDGKNDCLVLKNLPAGTCDNRFKRVAIYNRWGKEIYNNTQIGQNWCPDNVTAGFYHYLIEYTNKSYKGGITVIK